jgi:hypothetical protein
MGRAAAAVALVLAGLLLAACSAAGGSPQARVSGWASQSGIVSLDAQVATDVSSVESALATGRDATAKDLCSVLNDDVGQAYDELPSPDSRLTSLLDQADLSLDQGAVDCQSAVGSANHQLLDRAEGEIHAGSASLRAAAARLASFGVSTGTTGGPSGP